MTRAKKFVEDMFDTMEDMSELVDAAIDRVDLVGKAANGHRFILAKSEHNNLIPADVVRDFITKANEEEMPVEADIIKEDLDANTLMAEPADAGDGNPDEPGSPAWEAIDAATAAKWTAILARAKNAVCEMRDREKEEVEAGHMWDEDGVHDLKDAAEAIDYAISLLAPFAVSEQAEAEYEMMKQIETVVKGIKPKMLATAEQFAPIYKAGRTLSAANEAALKDASDAIAKVLESLPKAPVSPAADETNLGAETDRPEPAEIEKDRMADIIDTAIELVDEDVTKAEDMSGVSDDELARIALTGVDAERTSALQEIGLRALTAGLSGDAPAEGSDMEDMADEAEELNEDDAVVTEPADTDMEPAPVDEVGVSADELTKTSGSSEKKKLKVKKVEKLVKEATDEQSSKYAAIIKSLEDRIATLEAPAPSKVLTNGALPPAHLMRGQDAGGSRLSDAAALRKQVDDAPDAVTKSEATEQMRLAALDALSALRNA